MLKNLYSLRDNKSGTHKDLFPANNHEEAKRLIHAAALPPSGPTLFASYPDDFTLFFHGELDYTTGIISSLEYNFDVHLGEAGHFKPVQIATVRQILIEFDKSFRDAELMKARQPSYTEYDKKTDSYRKPKKGRKS